MFSEVEKEARVSMHVTEPFVEQMFFVVVKRVRRVIDNSFVRYLAR